MFKTLTAIVALTFAGAAYASPACEWPGDPSAAAGNYDPYARAISNMANEGCMETVADHIAGLKAEEANLRAAYNAGMEVIRQDPGACYGCMPRMEAMRRQLARYPAAIAAARKYSGAATPAEAEAYRADVAARVAQRVANRPKRKTMEEFRAEAQAYEKSVYLERCLKLNNGYNCDQYR